MTTQNNSRNLGQQARSNTLREIAKMSLMGLDKPYYSCVLQRRDNTKHLVWQGVIQLDGYCKKIHVSVANRRHKDINGNLQDQYQCQISGLKPLLKRCDFDLKLYTDAPSRRKKISGYVDLSVARLIVTLVPTTDVFDEPIILCLLEVRRDVENFDDE
ncbi:hypothetical protein [Neptunicoccus sediminis]|uniref:hypothetical protein n=1 Tax=Neptunicoccus sediminis TaxID=1892596 RepID=UPI0008460188|nr:hypothetical protein [Neptunicoccus sediminis]